ncbi:homoserine O-acetyltransferase, partial [Streptomyces sp. NPDC057674]
DRLYPLAQQEELAAGIPSADTVRVIRSPYGHDGFLLETDQVGALVRELLDGVPGEGGAGVPA